MTNKPVLAIAIGISAAVILAGATPASATENHNAVTGTVNSNGTYTQFTSQRHVTTAQSTIQYTPSNLPSGGICVKLISDNSGAQFGNTVCWTDHSTKTLATDVLNGTIFHFEAKKVTASGTDNYFSGSLYY